MHPKNPKNIYKIVCFGKVVSFQIWELLLLCMFMFGPVCRFLLAIEAVHLCGALDG